MVSFRSAPNLSSDDTSAAEKAPALQKGDLRSASYDSAESAQSDHVLGIIEDVSKTFTNVSAHQLAEERSKRKHTLLKRGLTLTLLLAALSFLPLLIHEFFKGGGDEVLTGGGGGDATFWHIVDEGFIDSYSAKKVAVGHAVSTLAIIPFVVILLYRIEKLAEIGNRCSAFVQGFLLTSFLQLRTTCGQFLKIEYAAFVKFYSELCLWLLGYTFCHMFVHSVKSKALNFLDDLDDKTTRNISYQLTLENMMRFTTWSDPVSNDIYSFHRRRTACQMLQVYVKVVSSVAQALPVLPFVCWYLQMELLGSVLALGGIVSSAFALVGLGTGLKNLFFIAQERPFYLGDLLDIDGLVGFVENFTPNHLVVRDFDCKQVWINYATLTNSRISNWRRRQTRLIFMKFAIDAKTDSALVRELVESTRAWAEAKESVNQMHEKGLDQLIFLTSVDHGYVLYAQIAPRNALDYWALQEELILYVMKVALEKNIPIVSHRMAAPFPGPPKDKTQPIHLGEPIQLGEPETSKGTGNLEARQDKVEPFAMNL